VSSLLKKLTRGGVGIETCATTAIDRLLFEPAAQQPTSGSTILFALGGQVADRAAAP
jgi:hypothetical protein